MYVKYDECLVVMLAVDETDGKVTLSNAAAAGGSGDAGHHLARQESSVDNKAVSWTSAEVLSWLERSHLQHLTDWYVKYTKQH